MIFVTGGTGFLGSYLLHHLVSKGEKVRALKRKNSPMQMVEPIKDQVEWIEGDLLDLGSLEDALENVTHVYHAAAMVSFSPDQQETMKKVNIEGTANLVNLCLQLPIKKMVYVSSIAALGRTENQNHINESNQWQQSSLNTKYAITKFHSECEVWRGIEEGLNAVIINPSVIIGSGFWNTSTCKLFKQVSDGLSFYPTGRTGFVDVRDVAKVMRILMHSDIIGQRFIVNSENLFYKPFFAAIANQLNKKAPSIKVTPLLREIAWRLEWVKSKISGSNPLITKETATISANQFIYNNSKLIQAIDYSYTPIQETIQETCAQFLDAKKSKANYSILPF